MHIAPIIGLEFKTKIYSSETVLSPIRTPIFSVFRVRIKSKLSGVPSRFINNFLKKIT